MTRYIFPGGELDYLGMSVANLQCHGFEVRGVESWQERYGRTCRLWLDRLSTRMPEAEVESGSVKTRLWLAYLAGCSLAFSATRKGSFSVWRRSACGARWIAADTGGSVRGLARSEMHSRIPTLYHLHLTGDGCAE